MKFTHRQTDEKKYYHLKNTELHILRDMSFSIYATVISNQS